MAKRRGGARKGGGGPRKKKTGGDRRNGKGAPKERRDHLEIEGEVTNVFAGGQFEVESESGPVRAQVSGRMRKHRIRVLLGDRVTVALSPYDLTHGMIVYRHK